MSARLRSRLVDDGTLLEGGIIKMTSFFNHQVDMKCVGGAARELAERTRALGATKVLTAPASGLLCAAPLSEALGLDFVYTRERLPVTFKGEPVSTVEELSHTTGRTASYSVLHTALAPGDRVLIADDVLAYGRTLLALAALVSRCGASVVGFAVLLEKGYQGGRDRVTAKHPGVPLFAAVTVLSVDRPLSKSTVLALSDSNARL
eukprot:Rhum_TRINITY_DN1005_c0_g1::Rhum_TRINITY_DN1005_c0_g1_i1::g.3131::m.3131/K03816/xpt; xanthine phosphoribosyltransferase